MSTIATRLTSTGIYYVDGQFDEVSYNPTGGANQVAYSTASTRNNNLLINSGDYSNTANWNLAACKTAFTTATTAPDGTYTAQKFIEDTSTAEHWFYQTTNGSVAGQVMTYSFYAKAAERSQINLRFIGAVNLVFLNINLITGVVSNPNLIPNGISYSVTNAGNGWWRIVATGTVDQQYILGSLFLIQNSPYTTNYAGDGTSGLYLWGQQQEYGATATPYVATDSYGPIARANINMFSYTQDISNSYWNSSTVTRQSNAGIAPDGSYTAGLITAVSGSYGGLFREWSHTLSANTTYTLSVYAKAGTNNYIGLRIDGNSNSSGDYSSHYDLSNGTATSVVPIAGTINSVGITNGSNGWQRCFLTYTTGATVSSSLLDITITPSSGATAGPYAGTESVYIWGPQLQTGNVIAPYIATTTANTVINTFNAKFNSFGNVLTIGSLDEVSYNPNGGFIGQTSYSTGSKNPNVLFSSQIFDPAIWNYNAIPATVVLNSTTAPNGTVSGVKLVSNTSAVSTYQGISTRNINQPSASILTFSIYAKAAEWNYLNVANDPAGGAAFNLSTGNVAYFSPNFTSASITPANNGWYRCSTTCTSEVWGSIILQMGIAGTPINTMTGDGTSGIYIWGAQLEPGSQATAYNPTNSTGSISTPTTNLLAATKNFTDSYNWLNNRLTTISTTQLAPDGTYTATEFAYNIQYSYIAQGYQATANNINLTAGQSYTASIYVKQNYPFVANSAQFAINTTSNPASPPVGGTACVFYFDSPTNASIASEYGAYNSSITPAENGFYRCSTSFIANVGQTSQSIQFWMGGYNGNNNTNVTMTLWGPQLQQGNVLSPYVATGNNSVAVNNFAGRISSSGQVTTTGYFDEYTWNPAIVTTGLTLNLDAAIPNSYNGGSNWVDITANAAVATLLAGVNYSPTYPGTIYFPGGQTTNHVTLPSQSTGGNLGFYQSSFTVSTWINTANTWIGNVGPGIVSLNGSAVAGGQYAMMVRFGYFDVDFYGDTQATSGPITANVWYNLVHTYNYANKQSNIWLNGSFDNNRTRTQDLVSSIQNQPLKIGTYFYGGYDFLGNIGAVQIYNRELSTAEIKQNYNAMSGRYGLPRL